MNSGGRALDQHAYSRCNCRAALRILAAAVFAAAQLTAQTWDIPASLAEAVSSAAHGQLRVGFEQRTRYEMRGDIFGAPSDVDTGLTRTRLSLTFENSWLKVSGMMQDSRAPWHGPNAPVGFRNPADLQEAYISLFPERKSGWSAEFGRRMLSYGEGRLIGTPDWNNTSRTYDHARVSWLSKRARIDAIILSAVKVRTDGFDRPELGDRVWGVYSSFPDIAGKTLLEAYLLRHDQNHPAGFAGGSAQDGTDRLGINTAGFRLAGPIAPGWRYSLEGAAQTGHVAAERHRAAGWYSLVGRHWTIAGRPFEITAEYKYASGTRDARDGLHAGTFDQLYAANHDKFGHEDLLGWRNIHNIRSVASYDISKGWTWSVMYNQFWLASPCDALYNGGGAPIARSASCSAGSHVGQEGDVFMVYHVRRFQFGAGYGYFGAGEFLRKTVPGVSPTYIYLFHTYTL